MKRGLVLSLCAVTLAALSVGRAAAQAPTVTLSLDLFYNDAATTTSAGSWQLLAKGSSQGLAGLVTQLTGINGAGGGAVFSAPQPAFKLMYDAKPWNTDVDGNAATLDFLYGQIPLAAGMAQDLAYGVGVTTVNPDELGVTVSPGGINMASAVLLSFGTFSANSTPAINAALTKANVFTAQGNATNPPAAGSILEAAVTVQTRNNIATLPGDANLDKTVNLNDLTVLGTFFGQSDKIWQQGDFTGDKTVNLNDLTVLGTFFGQSASVPAVAAVPEPASIGLVGIALAGLGCLRRRR